MLAMVCWKVIAVAGLTCGTPIDLQGLADWQALAAQRLAKENDPTIAVAFQIRSEDFDWALPLILRAR